MKKIIPFNNVVDFNTDVKEITAISLEHEINKYPDMISGVFYITGEYKMTEGILEKEQFNFELPFDIALTNNYNLDTLIVDIDDFRYDVISDKSLKVNIDLYIDGEEIEIPLPRDNHKEELPIEDDIRNLDEEIIIPPKEELMNKKETQNLEELISNIDTQYETVDSKTPEDKIIDPTRIDLLKDMLTNNKENNMNEETNLNININNTIEDKNTKVNTNILNNDQEEEKYVTYRVYKVCESDTIDSILTKYNVTKEMLSDYNNIENIKPGDKLIIPTNSYDEK